MDLNGMRGGGGAGCKGLTWGLTFVWRARGWLLGTDVGEGHRGWLACQPAGCRHGGDMNLAHRARTENAKPRRAGGLAAAAVAKPDA